jgi:hypothetical protein
MTEKGSLPVEPGTAEHRSQALRMAVKHVCLLYANQIRTGALSVEDMTYDFIFEASQAHHYLAESGYLLSHTSERLTDKPSFNLNP